MDPRRNQWKKKKKGERYSVETSDQPLGLDSYLAPYSPNKFETYPVM